MELDVIYNQQESGFLQLTITEYFQRSTKGQWNSLGRHSVLRILKSNSPSTSTPLNRGKKKRDYQFKTFTL
ncbi:hypothetical protein [Trichodesmium erythraeum]|uniref:hypothetical protein n=1 Tax=Trichodesmium erythraeum TaxID=1206 RepID=UPI0002F7A940|nr:hypothetical protein [Trichodesmium erythraeum GBRTRLIN201]MDE5096614.1 hypothetical protein [Trichodesmium sp. St11_bin5]